MSRLNLSRFGLLATVALGALVACQVSVTAAHAEPVQAIRTSDFLNSIAVNLHLNSEWDTSYSDAANGGVNGGPSVAKIAEALNFTNIRHVRGPLTADYIAARFATLSTLVPHLMIDDLMDANAGQGSFSDLFNRAGLFANQIEAFEGLNEATNSARYAGKTGAAADCQWQMDLFNGVKAWNAANKLNIPTLAPSVAASDGFAGLSPCAWAADASNGHSYVDWRPPTQNKLDDLKLETQDAPAGAPNWVTETGPITNPAVYRGMSEDVAAKRTLEMLLAFKKTTVRTYLYELVDEGSDAPEEGHFGLYHADWTPKVAATALHNQAQDLADPGATAATFAPGKLDYAISGGNGVHSLLMQKSDGSFMLALWSEPEMWKPASGNTAGSVIPIAATNLTVTFPPMVAVSVVDPMETKAPSSLNTGTMAMVSLQDHPVYLQLIPAATLTPPAPVVVVAATPPSTPPVVPGPMATPTSIAPSVQPAPLPVVVNPPPVPVVAPVVGTQASPPNPANAPVVTEPVIITPVPSYPLSISAPASYTIRASLTGMAVSDTTKGDAQVMLSISATGGTLNGSMQSVWLTGTVDQINAALGTLVFNPTSGQAAVALVYSGHNGQTVSRIVPINTK